MIIDNFDKHFPRYYANPFKHDEFSSFDYIDQSTLYETINGLSDHIIYWFDADFDVRSYKDIVVKIYSIDNLTCEPKDQVINFNGNVKLLTDINEVNDIQINYFGVIHDKQYRCGIFVHKNYADMFMHVEYKSSGYTKIGKVSKIYSKMSGEIELWSKSPDDRTKINTYDNCFLRDSYNPNNYISSNESFIKAMRREHETTCNELKSTSIMINQQKIFNTIRKLTGPEYNVTSTTGYARHRNTSACTGGPWCYIGTSGWTAPKTSYTRKETSFSSIITDKPSLVNNSSDFIPANISLNYSINSNNMYNYKNRVILSIKDNLYSMENKYQDSFIKLNNTIVKHTNECLFPFLPKNDAADININWTVSGGVFETYAYGDRVYWPGGRGSLSPYTITFKRTSTVKSSDDLEYNPDTYDVYDKNEKIFEMANNLMKLYFITE